MFALIFFAIVHNEIYLRASADPKETYGNGGAFLSWTKATGNNVQYVAYQRIHNTKEWEMISTYENGQTINVLNIYPGEAKNNVYSKHRIPVDTCSLFKGAGPKYSTSGLLRLWMEGGSCTIDDSISKILFYQPYGLIPGNRKMTRVITKSIDEFEANPSIIFGYDVVVFGFWNGSPNGLQSYIVQSFIKPYIDKGGSFIIGHGTISDSWHTNQGDIFLSPIAASHFGTEMYHPPGYDRDKRYKKAIIKKKGAITLYPHYIGEIGDSINIKETHTASGYVHGDTYFELDHSDIPKQPSNKNSFSYATIIEDSRIGSIEIGHSLYETEEVELKILANMIHYMKKMTESTHFISHSTIDIDGPVVVVNQITDDEISWVAKDIGTKYDLKVDAIADRNIENLVDSSNIVKIEIKTGLQGFYYVIDKNPNTIINGDKKKEKYTEELNYKYKPSERNSYFHIAAIDKAKNIGDTIHCIMATPSPTPLPTKSPSPSRSPTPSPSKSPTPSRSPTPSPSKSPTPSRSPTPSPSKSPTPSRSPTPSPSKSPTPSPSKSPTPSRSSTPSPSKSSSLSKSPTPSRSQNPSPSKSPTPSRSPTLSPMETQNIGDITHSRESGKGTIGINEIYLGSGIGIILAIGLVFGIIYFNKKSHSEQNSSNAIKNKTPLPVDKKFNPLFDKDGGNDPFKEDFLE